MLLYNSALITWGGSIVFDSSILFAHRVLVSLFVLLLIVPLVFSIMSFRATTDASKGITKKFFVYLKSHNRISVAPAKNMFYAYIYKYYETADSYLEAVCCVDIKADEKPFLLQISQQIVDLAGVAYRKSVLFNIAIRIECLIFSLGGIFALITLFVKCISRIA